MAVPVLCEGWVHRNEVREHFLGDIAIKAAGPRCPVFYTRGDRLHGPEITFYRGRGNRIEAFGPDTPGECPREIGPRPEV